jgi:hypothetical protein
MDRPMGSMVKVGKHWINLDRMLWAFEGETSGIGTDPKPVLNLVFTDASELALLDDDREAMAKHLDAGAIDLTPATDDDRAFAEYRKQGGGMARPAWEASRLRHRSLMERYDRNGEWTKDEDRQVAELESQLLY